MILQKRRIFSLDFGYLQTIYFNLCGLYSSYILWSTYFICSHHHFVNAHGNVFNGDIRCDDSNMIMGVERKWAPTMMKLDADRGGSCVVSEEPEEENKEDEAVSGTGGNSSFSATIPNPQGTQHFFLEILRTKHGVWHMWIWYLGEPDEAGAFRCEIAIRCEIL